MPPSSAKEPPVPDWQRDAPFPDVGYTYAPESAWRVSQDSQLAIHAVYADIPIHQPQQYAAYPQFAPYSIAVAEGQQAVQAPPADPSRVAPSPNYSPPPQPPLPTYRSDVPYHDDGRAPPSNYPPFITIPPSVPDSGEKGKHREAESSAQPKIDYDKVRYASACVSRHSLMIYARWYSRTRPSSQPSLRRPYWNSLPNTNLTKWSTGC